MTHQRQHHFCLCWQTCPGCSAGKRCCCHPVFWPLRSKQVTTRYKRVNNMIIYINYINMVYKSIDELWKVHGSSATVPAAGLGPVLETWHVPSLPMAMAPALDSVHYTPKPRAKQDSKISLNSPSSPQRIASRGDMMRNVYIFLRLLQLRCMCSHPGVVARRGLAGVAWPCHIAF